MKTPAEISSRISRLMRSLAIHEDQLDYAKEGVDEAEKGSSEWNIALATRDLTQEKITDIEAQIWALEWVLE